MQHSYGLERKWICFVKLSTCWSRWSVKEDCRLMEVHQSILLMKVWTYVRFFIIENFDLAKGQKTQNYIWDVLLFIIDRLNELNHSCKLFNFKEIFAILIYVYMYVCVCFFLWTFRKNEYIKGIVSASSVIIGDGDFHVQTFIHEFRLICNIYELKI